MRFHLASRIAPSRARPRSFHPGWLIAAGLAIAAAACGSGDGPTAPAERPPVFDSLGVTNSGSTYLRAWLGTKVSDPDGNLTRVVAFWGDGKTDQWTSGFDKIETTHDYATYGTYTVSVTAYDGAGDIVTGQRSLTTDPVPHSCFDAYVFSICATVQPSYDGIDFVTKLAGVEVAHSSLTTAKNSSQGFIPVGGLLGQVKVVTTGTFSRTRNASALTVDVYGCALFLVCTSDLAEKSYRW